MEHDALPPAPHLFEHGTALRVVYNSQLETWGVFLELGTNYETRRQAENAAHEFAPRLVYAQDVVDAWHETNTGTNLFDNCEVGTHCYGPKDYAAGVLVDGGYLDEQTARDIAANVWRPAYKQARKIVWEAMNEDHGCMYRGVLRMWRDKSRNQIVGRLVEYLPCNDAVVVDGNGLDIGRVFVFDDAWRTSDK